MQVEKLQDDIVASHGVGDAQDAQDDAVRALASGRNFFFCDDLPQPSTTLHNPLRPPSTPLNSLAISYADTMAER